MVRRSLLPLQATQRESSGPRVECAQVGNTIQNETAKDEGDMLRHCNGLHDFSSTFFCRSFYPSMGRALSSFIAPTLWFIMSCSWLVKLRESSCLNQSSHLPAAGQDMSETKLQCRVEPNCQRNGRVRKASGPASQGFLVRMVFTLFQKTLNFVPNRASSKRARRPVPLAPKAHTGISTGAV